MKAIKFLHTLPGFALLALVACNEPAATDPAGEPQLARSASATLVECPSGVSHSTESTILPLGGSVELRGHRVDLPTGAVLGPTTIGLAEPASQYMMIDLSANGQDHFQFHEPLTITIDYSRCTRANIDKGPLSVWLVDPTTGALLQHMGGTDDKATQRITFQTDHFSGYAIAN